MIFVLGLAIAQTWADDVAIEHGYARPDTSCSINPHHTAPTQPQRQAFRSFLAPDHPPSKFSYSESRSSHPINIVFPFSLTPSFPTWQSQRNARRDMSSSGTSRQKDHSIQSAQHVHYPFWFGGSASCFAAAVTHPLDLSTSARRFPGDHRMREC